MTTTATRKEPSPVVDLAARRAQSEKVTLAEVQKAWAELVTQATTTNLGRAAHLNEAEPLSVDGGTVVIGFTTDFARALWQDRQRSQLEQGLSERLNTPVRVRCVVQAVPSSAPPASDDPMHRAALEIFRRPDRIMEIE
jgi:chromosomal replication initiation ATPase DnaA